MYVHNSRARGAGASTYVMQPVYHPAGTVAMAPRADGGAVDTKFRLYGAANVRVVGELPLYRAQGSVCSVRLT
jgi:choline dehydrogenase-like flavoprotein